MLRRPGRFELSKHLHDNGLWLLQPESSVVMNPIQTVLQELDVGFLSDDSVSEGDSGLAFVDAYYSVQPRIQELLPELNPREKATVRRLVEKSYLAFANGVVSAGQAAVLFDERTIRDTDRYSESSYEPSLASYRNPVPCQKPWLLTQPSSASVTAPRRNRTWKSDAQRSCHNASS